jgi:hypothetical protein
MLYITFNKITTSGMSGHANYKVKKEELLVNRNKIDAFYNQCIIVNGQSFQVAESLQTINNLISQTI